MDNEMSDAQPRTDTCKRKDWVDKDNPYKYPKTQSTSSESKDHFSEEDRKALEKKRQAISKRVDSLCRNKAFLNYVESTQAIQSGTPYLSVWNGKVVKVFVYPGAKVKENDALFVLNLEKDDAYIFDFHVEESSSFESPKVSESVKSKEDTVTISSSAAATKVASNFSQLSVSEAKTEDENTMVISSRVNGGRGTFCSSKVLDDAAPLVPEKESDMKLSAVPEVKPHQNNLQVSENYKMFQFGSVDALSALQDYDNRPYVVKAHFGAVEVTEVLLKEGMKVKKLQPLFGYKSKKTGMKLFEFQTDEYLEVDRARIEKSFGVPIYYPTLPWPAESESTPFSE